MVRLSAFLALVAAVLCGCPVSHAAVTYSGGTYTQDFDTLAVGPTGNTNPWTDDVTIVGWYALDGTTPSTTYKAQNGNDAHHYLTSAGANGSTDRALGAMSWSPQHTWGVRLTNATGGTLDSFTLTYAGEEWRDQGTGDVLFSYSTDATSLQSGTWTAESDLNFVPPHKSPPPYALDGNDPANRVVLTKTVEIPGGWANGTDLWLRWVMGPSNGALLAIDDLSFSATGQAQAPIPEPATLVLLAGGLPLLLRRRRA